MKAISTRFMPATNTRGARIVADDGDRNRISIPYPHELNHDEAHAFAAKTLRDKMKWKGEMIGGGTRTGMCFVFANSEPRFNPSKRLTLEKVRDELRPLGLSIRKRDDEYRVAFTASASPHDRAGIEASAYYTDDLSDAWATGLEMARGQKRNPARVSKRSRRAARALVTRYGGKRRARGVAGGMIGRAQSPAQREHFVRVRKSINPRKRTVARGAMRANPLPMFPIYVRKSSAQPWALIGVFSKLENARNIGNLIRLRGYQVRVTDGKD